MFACQVRCLELVHSVKWVKYWRNFCKASDSLAVPCTSSTFSSDEQQQQYSANIMDESEIKEDRKRFAELFRRSKFVQLADFEGRIVIGEIVRRIGDDLYIDMGLKFNAVCKAPIIKNENYRIGTKVLLRLHDPELSELFLGSTKELTLLEADATLLGLYRSQSGESTEAAFFKTVEKEVERVKSSKPEIADQLELQQSAENPDKV
uniref:S1 motif domain-containing protein n=1 Tax=Setaria digitata TaxID=48799 RepID=A0A915PJG5_9BILA